MIREFAVTAPNLRMAWLLLGVPLLLAITGLAFAAREKPEAWIALPVLLLVSALITIGIRRRSVVLEGQELRVQAGLNSCRVPLGAIDLARSRIVSLDEHTALRPMLRTFGTSLPGYNAGHFRLRDRGRAFVLLTARTRVLVLHERSGRRLLLSLEKPQALLDALHAAQYR